MLEMTHLIGFGGGQTAPPITLAYTDIGGSSANSSGSGYNGTASLGTAAADRYIIVVTMLRGSATVDSLTLGGNAMSLLHRATAVGNQNHEFWGLAVPSGTSAALAVSLSSTASNMRWYVYALYGLLSPTPASVDQSSLDPADFTVGVPEGGAVIAIASNQDAAATFTWSGLTENHDGTLETSFSYGSTASATFPSGNGSAAVSADFSTSSGTHQTSLIVLR